jgi:DNA modification methylase
MEGRGFSECEVAWWSENKSSRIYRYSPTRMKKQHKTQKPLGLMQWCIGLANAPETIVDPFMGSGTTLHAAQLEGRHCVGIEREESYCEIAADRLAQKVLF